MKKRKVIADFALNIISTTFPVLLLQMFFLPRMAVRLGDARYGLLVTLASLMTIVPANMGNVLNNIRLLYHERYQERDRGDFNVLLLIFSALNILLVLFLTILYEDGLHPVSLLMTVILSVIWLFQSYFVVGFRIELNYTGILSANLFKITGFFFGYFLFCISGIWQFVYMFGYLFSLVYICVKTGLWREAPSISPAFSNTTAQTFSLLFARTLSSTITYADKLLIYPLLGGVTVSTYYAATVFGKIISLGVSPMNSVALTYLSKLQKKKDNLFGFAICSGGILCLIGYVFCILVSRPVLNWLYPQFVDGAMNLIYITTATCVVQTMIAIADPFILKFFKMKWQIFLNGCTAIIYVSLGLFLLSLNGVFGFCCGVLIANVLKFISMLLIYHNAAEIR